MTTKKLWDACPISKSAFQKLVFERGAELYRDMPWRHTKDPYAILVSEVMLQQTQVQRVEKFWPRWMATFPTLDALAASDTHTVLERWQGLGYNRRALALKKACEWCAQHNAGRLPDTSQQLQTLPGIGPATAGGVIAFAHDKPAVYLETNVRSVFLHELFPEQENVHDKEIIPYVIDACPKREVSTWYYALLDYGAYLKAHLDNPSRRSAHATRQSTFEGSHRQKRSLLLSCVLSCPEGITRKDAQALIAQSEKEKGHKAWSDELFDCVVQELIGEGFFREQQGKLIP